jgi:hypothetical protein
MKSKIIQVRGVAIEKTYDSINDELRNDLNKNLVVKETLNFPDAYKTNKRGCHYDIFLGRTGTIMFRPFHFVDGLDDFCYFDLKKYSTDNIHALEFYLWSSARESKMELWFNGEHQITASQKKSIRANGNKTLIRNNDIYESTNYYLKYIVGLTIEEMTTSHQIYRCEVEKK